MEDLPNNLNDFFIEPNKTPIEDKETFDYFSLYHSNGYARLKDYIKVIQDNITYSSKQKLPEESLESYAAKRMRADGIVDCLDNIMLHIESEAKMYNPNDNGTK